MNKIIKYLLFGAIFLLFLTGCMASESDEVSIQKEEGEVLASTADFTEASVEYQEQNEQYIIHLTFKDEDTFEEITKSHIGEAVHIYLNEELISSPMINAVLRTETIVIEGDYDKETAEHFVAAINNQ